MTTFEEYDGYEEEQRELEEDLEAWREEFWKSYRPFSRNIATREQAERSIGSMSWWADSHARTSAWRAAVRALKANEADCGLRCSDAFAWFDPSTLSWRTFQVSLTGDSTPFLGVWPLALMMRRSIVYRRQPSGRAIDAIGSSSLPTPSATPYGTNRSPSNGARVRPSLQTMASKNLWPTPWASASHGAGLHGKGGMDLQTAVKQGESARPTPRSHCVDMGTLLMAKYSGQARKKRLPGSDYDPENGGMLNPTWVEWLMGFPIGWTDSDASETPSSPRSRKQ
jgi:hypothetical protein